MVRHNDIRYYIPEKDNYKINKNEKGIKWSLL